VRSGLPVNQKTLEKPRTKTKSKTQRPPLWKVILLNDDFTPREFVVLVLKAIFRMNESHAYKVMMTAHQRGACVIAVYTRDVAETKAMFDEALGPESPEKKAFVAAQNTVCAPVRSNRPTSGKATNRTRRG